MRFNMLANVIWKWRILSVYWLISISALLQTIWINKLRTGLWRVYALPFFLFNDRLKLIDDNARQAYGIIMTYF